MSLKMTRQSKKILSNILSGGIIAGTAVIGICAVLALPFRFASESMMIPTQPKVVEALYSSQVVDTHLTPSVETETLDPFGYLTESESAAETETEAGPALTETEMIQTETQIEEPSQTELPATDPPEKPPVIPQQQETDPPVTKPHETKPPETEPPVTEPPVTEPPETEPPQTEPPETEPPETEPPVTEPPQTEPPETEKPREPDPVGLTYVDLISKERFKGTLLTETELAEKSYIDKILFLGDSLTDGMRGYGFTTDEQTIFPTKESHETITLYHTPDVLIWDPIRKIETTVIDCIGYLQPDLLYIELGVNGIGWEDEKTFRTEYDRLLKAIKNACPNTTIVCSSMYPVAQKYKYQTGKNGVNNYKISLGNLWIAEIAQKYGVYFLNTAETLVGEDGFLRVEYVGNDGLHLAKSGYPPVITYMRKHRVPGF